MPAVTNTKFSSSPGAGHRAGRWVSTTVVHAEGMPAAPAVGQLRRGDVRRPASAERGVLLSKHLRACTPIRATAGTPAVEIRHRDLDVPRAVPLEQQLEAGVLGAGDVAVKRHRGSRADLAHGKSPAACLQIVRNEARRRNTRRSCRVASPWQVASNRHGLTPRASLLGAVAPERAQRVRSQMGAPMSSQKVATSLEDMGSHAHAQSWNLRARRLR